MITFEKTTPRIRYASIILSQLIKTDFSLRYQNSVLGYLWSLLKPLFLFTIMYSVFVKVLNVDYGVSNSGIYLLTGIVIWSFFSEVTGGSVTSIVNKGDVLRKLNMPKHVIVLAVVFSALINMLINIAVVLVFMLIAKVKIHTGILLVPFFIMELFVFSVSISLFLSTLYVRLRDVGYIWDVVLQALFYITPIFFPLSSAPLWSQKIVILSPLAQSIQDIRFFLVSRDTITIGKIYGSEIYRLIPIVITVFIFVFSINYFRRRSPFFAEEI